MPTERTKLSEREELKYQRWKTTIPKNLQYEGDYDLRGFWKENPTWKADDPKVHMTDKFKLPSHSTFSNESKSYIDPALSNTDKKPTVQEGGKWGNYNGKFGYIPNDPLNSKVLDSDNAEITTIHKKKPFNYEVLKFSKPNDNKKPYSEYDFENKSSNPQGNIDKELNTIITIGKLLDPTGISSYGDVYASWNDNKFDYNDILQPLSALPMVGATGKIIKQIPKIGKYMKGISTGASITDATISIKNIRDGNK